MVLRHSKISTSAFTLVELLVVIAIIGILSTLSVVALNSARSKARDARRLSDVKQIGMALEMYLDTKGVYPETPVLSDNGVITGLCISDLGISSTCGADVYLQKIPAGPKKNENYTYRSLYNQSDYRVNFELENNSGGFTAGPLSYSPSGLVRDIYSGLIGWWKFDETSGNIAYDSSGYNHHGDLFGSPAHVPGKINSALSFDGVDDYVHCGKLNLDWTNINFTAEAWALMNAGTSNNWRGIFSNRYGIGNSKWWTLGTNPYGNLYLELSATSPNIILSFQPVGQGWKHYVVVKSGNEYSVYIDGVLQGRATNSTNIGGTTNEFRIGMWSGSGQIWNGLIDEVRIYNRALSAEEVLALFQDL